MIAIAILNAVGYWIFRGSNGQKDAFRRDPNGESVKHLETLTTKSGRKLIVSGWWGMARKINYTGDWIMGLSWCLYVVFKRENFIMSLKITQEHTHVFTKKVPTL